MRAIQVLVDIATEKRADAAVRVKAATTIMELVLGKVPERVHLAPDELPPFMKAIQSGLVHVVPTENHALPAGDDDEDT